MMEKFTACTFESGGKYMPFIIKKNGNDVAVFDTKAEAEKSIKAFLKSKRGRQVVKYQIVRVVGDPDFMGDVKSYYGPRVRVTPLSVN